MSLNASVHEKTRNIKSDKYKKKMITYVDAYTFSSILILNRLHRTWKSFSSSVSPVDSWRSLAILVFCWIFGLNCDSKNRKKTVVNFINYQKIIFVLLSNNPIMFCNPECMHAVKHRVNSTSENLKNVSIFSATGYFWRMIFWKVASKKHLEKIALFSFVIKLHLFLLFVNFQPI